MRHPRRHLIRHTYGRHAAAPPSFPEARNGERGCPFLLRGHLRREEICARHLKETNLSPYTRSPDRPLTSPPSLRRGPYSPIFNLRSPESECLRAVNMVSAGGWSSWSVGTAPRRGGHPWAVAERRPGRGTRRRNTRATLRRRQSTSTDQMFQPTPRST